MIAKFISKLKQRYLYKRKEKQKGVAIMMAVFFVALMSFMIFEISKETLYVSIVTSQEIHELKAYYAAKSGLDISLLRIKAYQQVKDQIEQMGEMAAPFAQKADIIWQFPFVWPPVLPEEAGLVAQNQMDEILKETFMQKVQYAPMIEDMGSKINLSNLDSPSKALADSTREQLLEVFRKIIRDDESFSDKYVINEIEVVIDHIKDWMDADTEATQGGDESSFYTSRGERNLPPNQYFKTKEELMLVEGMTHDIYEILDQTTTIFGNPGININQASPEVLMSLDPNMNEDVIEELIKRREDLENHGPFSEDLFRAFINEMLGSWEAFNPSRIPIFYSAVANFKIESTGSSGRINKTIEAYVFDQNSLLDTMIEGLKEQDENQGVDGSSANPNSSNNPNNNGDPNNPNSTNNTNSQKTKRPRPQGPPPIMFLKVF